MTTQNYNRVQILYKAEHKPYLYGLVHRVDGDPNNQWLEKPFVISKKMWNGEEVVYGTVKRLLEKIIFQLDRLKRFQSEAQATLDSAGIAPLSRENPILPESEASDRILDDQDALIEDVLVTTSVDIRILSEIFPRRLKKAWVTVYDYDDQRVGQIELSMITDLLVHNRYICIRDQFVVDLLSDERFMDVKPQMGLKINFLEYIAEVEKVVNGITVKDLVTKLWGMTKELSASSNIRDIILLHQNLYTLGGLVVGSGKPIDSGPLKTILDRAALKYLEKVYPKASRSDGSQIQVGVVFNTPRFCWEPDLEQKQIRIAVQVNGNSEVLVMGYEEFFSELLKGYGNTKLFAPPVG